MMGELEEAIFLSTPSARRATAGAAGDRGGQQISIHALREEGNPRRVGQLRPHSHFYPRPPRGGRLVECDGMELEQQFLSTPSARRATFHPIPSSLFQQISIHALREEGDLIVLLQNWMQWNFYPRPPRGGRPAGCPVDIEEAEFLSTPSARRATEPPEI